MSPCRSNILPRLSIAWALLGALLPVSLRGDTVHLKNGHWIDGVVRRETDSAVDIQIGAIGVVSVSRNEILRIEKNEKKGSEKAVRITEVVRPAGEPAEVASGSEDGEPSDEPESDDEVEAAESEEAGSDAPGPSVTEDRKRAAGDRSEGDSVEEIDPALEKEIREQIQELKRQRARNRVRAERRLDSIGKPALPYLLEAARNEASLVRTAVFRFVLRHGDESAIDACLEALDDENEFVRDFAHRSLRRISGEDLGYRPLASASRRHAAIKRWRDWWRQEQEELAKLREKAGD